METKPYKPPVRELASRIYVELVLRAGAESGAKAADPLELAKLSFKLAEAFQAVEDELNAANLPKNTGFKLQTADIDQWSK